ncbi:MAG: c-type cytochrome biogenesis protein CcmI [Azonexus sp.]|jgi:cytochrome c-type biogenesis protein CcmH|nr:c-type cytochrome biogenesis protein CcmI [Azonexus sp.]
MMPFVLSATLIVAVICACLFFPLWFAKRPAAAKVEANDQQSANLAFFHDQLADLEREHQEGALSAADFEQARQELQRRLLEEATPATAPAVAQSAGPSKITAIALVILLPLGAALGYKLLGQPAALDPAKTAAASAQAGGDGERGMDQNTKAQIAAMVERLAARLEKEPDNLQGWLMLAKSYEVIGRKEDAARALANADKLVGKLADTVQKNPDDLQNGLLLAATYQALGQKDNADKIYAAIEKRLTDAAQKKPDEINGWLALINSYKGIGRYNAARKVYARIEPQLGDNQDLLLDYAETVAMANDQMLTGKPLELVERVLKINPKNPDALVLAGYGALEANDTPKAISLWQTALPLMQPGSDQEKNLRLHLDQLGAGSATATAAAPEQSAQAQAAPPPGHPATGAEAGAGPQGLSPEEQKQVDERVARLAARLKDNPDDTQGWLKLANSYKVLGRYDEAVKAYAGIENKIGDNPDLLISYAEAIALANGRSMAGKPTQLVERALKINPKNLDGLLLAGSAAMEAKDNKKAIAYWDAALPLVEPGSELEKNLRMNLEQLKKAN